MSEDERIVTRAVISRAKARHRGLPVARNTRNKSHLLKTQKLSRIGCLLNTTILFAPLIKVVSRLTGMQQYGFMIWLVFSVLLKLIYHGTFESILMPILIVASLEPQALGVNYGIVLSFFGWYGTLMGSLFSVWYDHMLWSALAAPFAFVLSIYGARILGSSIPRLELNFLVCGIVNLIYYHKRLFQIILSCGLLGFVPCYLPLRRIVDIQRCKQWSKRDSKAILRLTICTYILYFGTSGFFFALGLSKYSHVDKLIKEIYENRQLLAYWVACLAIAMVITGFVATKTSLDVRRKLWHVCSVVMFAPAAHIHFIRLALAVALILFLFLEMVRGCALRPFGHRLHRVLQHFTDHRDRRGPMIISHIYLLLGISIPMFIEVGSQAGIICLGLADTCASQIGRRFGRCKIFGEKSLEGTIAFAIAAAFGLYTFDESLEFSKIAVIAVLTSLMEAIGSANDNLAVPVYMLALKKAVNT